VKDWADRIRQGSFVVLGRVGMDLYADPVGTRVEDAARFTATIGGSAGNIAVALVRQGANAALLTRVSDDAVGRFCIARLAEFGVSTAHVHLTSGGARTSLAVTETCAEDCQVVLYRNDAADFALTVEDVNGVDFGLTAALVVTGTALAGEPSRSATLHALVRAKAAGVMTILDVDYRAYSWASRHEAELVCAKVAAEVDVVVGNDDEFALLAGDYAQGATFARALARNSAIFTVYKRGPEGSVTYTQDTSFRTGIFAVDALKPMGAGDGFLGGLLSSLARGDDLETAVRRGSATAAIIVAGVGCAPASPDNAQVDHFIAST
jgi:5-dehydro-2-deoxygluconokinase